MSFIVAIDGPSGAGKGTITSILAKKFNLLYLDTGATYRCITLKLLNENIDFNNIEKIKQVLEDTKIEINDKKFFLDGKDVTKEIRTKRVNENVSTVSHIPEVRVSLVNLQRKMAQGKDSILEGRDIGTNVFPNANVKIYLDASIDERVKRRVKQNKEQNIDISEEDVRKNIEERDYNDLHSTVAPLKKAEDAIYVDSSKTNIKQTVKIISKIIKKEKHKYDMIEDSYNMWKETPLKIIARNVLKFIFVILYKIVFIPKNINKKNLYSNKDEGVIVCANHISYMDATGIVMQNKRKVRFVAKSELFTNPVLHHWAHIFDIIPVKRGEGDLKSVKLCFKTLKNKEALGIFPEGTIDGLKKHTDLKNGAAYMAYKAKVKVIPVGIKGNFKPFRRVIFNYGEPIDVSKFKTDDPDWIENATDYIMDQIIKLSK